MNKIRIVFSSIVFIMLVSVFSNCKNSTLPKQTQSKGPLTLKGQKFELSGTFSAIDLEIVDSLLIILTYGDTYKFHVYNKNTLKLIGKFGMEGRGPSEYILPFIMSQKIKIRDSSYLLIHDNSLKRTNYVNILEAINKTNYYPKSLNSQNKKLSHAAIYQSAVMLADSFIVGTPNIPNTGKFFCYDIHKDEIIWEPYYPITKKAPVKMSQSDLYSSCLALRPNATDIAAASLFFKRIDILDKKGKLKRSVIFNQNKEPDFSNADSWPPKGSHEYFTSISVSQDFIYALDIDLEIGNREIIDTVSLIKTSWEDKGNPPEIFRMTPKVLKMEVDEENKKIFGIKPFNSFIYIYQIVEK